MACQAALVDVSAVNYAVPVERQLKRILRDVSLKVEAGSLHMLVGPNGCGKVRYAHTRKAVPVLPPLDLTLCSAESTAPQAKRLRAGKALQAEGLCAAV